MTRILCLLSLTALAACTSLPSATTPSGAGGDGQAAKLRPGMTPNDAFGLFGPEAGFERNPANWDESCLSYGYGPLESPSYIHARFVNDVLTSATDGHPMICSYDGAAPQG